jgi:hypothetical protein
MGIGGMNMNGFKVMADSYRVFVERGDMTEEQAKRPIEIYEFLATCSDDDFCTMVDSSAFNDIIKAYVKKATEILSSEDQEKVVDNLRWIFDENTAKEVLKKHS